ncbi:hypothetical protein ACWDZX_11900 [Streptomyces collinus]
MTKQYRAHPHRTAEDTRPAMYGHSRIARAALAAMTAAGLWAGGTGVAEGGPGPTATRRGWGRSANLVRGGGGGI